MEGLVEELTRGNVTEVKVVLASVIAALAVFGFDEGDSALHAVTGFLLLAELEAEEERRDARIERAEERREQGLERREEGRELREEGRDR